MQEKNYFFNRHVRLQSHSTLQTEDRARQFLWLLWRSEDAILPPCNDLFFLAFEWRTLKAIVSCDLRATEPPSPLSPILHWSIKSKSKTCLMFTITWSRRWSAAFTYPNLDSHGLGKLVGFHKTTVVIAHWVASCLHCCRVSVTLL